MASYASYSIGNQNATRGKHFFLFEFGYNFNWRVNVMLALKQKQPNTETSQMKVKLRWDVLLDDLSLFMSLTVARFIIWRTLRRRRQERATRRKQFKLIHGSHQAK